MYCLVKRNHTKKFGNENEQEVVEEEKTKKFYQKEASLKLDC